MKIISFAVNNFRGITGGLDSNKIDFSGSNTIFIFGKNNVGKSTFLMAYDFLYSSKTPVENDYNKKDAAKSIQFELEAAIDDIDLEKIQGNKKDSFSKYLSLPDKIIKIRRTFHASRDDKGKFSVTPPSDETLNPDSGNWDAVAFGTLGFSSIFQNILPRPILIKAMPTEAEVEGVVNDILSSKAKRNLGADGLQVLEEVKEKISDLQDKMYNPKAISDYTDEVNTSFRKLFPDTSIEFQESDKTKYTEDKLGRAFNVHFHKSGANGDTDQSIPTSYQSIGHGAVRSAIFSLLLMRDVLEEVEKHSDRKEYLILFEEPELFLHPELMKNLRELVYSVSDSVSPYQVLCASHSPQMIDISKTKSSLVRMDRNTDGTILFQIKDEDFESAGDVSTREALRQKLFEILRFNPYICESFYADEVILVEGPTEEIIIRGILQKEKTTKSVFIVNCGSITNIPFYQRIYGKFLIKYHVICDTDAAITARFDVKTNPVFTSGIQGSIYSEFLVSKTAGLLRVHEDTFEPAHQVGSIHETLRLPDYKGNAGKPFCANKYWEEVLSPNYENTNIEQVPIVKYVKEILSHSWVE